MFWARNVFCVISPKEPAESELGIDIIRPENRKLIQHLMVVGDWRNYAHASTVFLNSLFSLKGLISLDVVVNEELCTFDDYVKFRDGATKNEDIFH